MTGSQANIGSGRFVDRVETTAQAVFASFTRPADTNAYAAGDIIANNTTAGNVVPLVFPVKSSGMVLRARLNWGTTNALTWRLHLFTSLPTASAGDNAAFAASVPAGHYLGAIDGSTAQTIGTGGAGSGIPRVGNAMIYGPDQVNIWGLLEARGAYTPASAEIITAVLEVA